MGTGRRQNDDFSPAKEVHFSLPETSIEGDVQFNGLPAVKWLLTILAGRALAVASLLQKDSFQKSVHKHNRDVAVMS